MVIRSAVILSLFFLVACGAPASKEQPAAPRPDSGVATNLNQADGSQALPDGGLDAGTSTPPSVNPLDAGGPPSWSGEFPPAILLWPDAGTTGFAFGPWAPIEASQLQINEGDVGSPRGAWGAGVELVVWTDCRKSVISWPADPGSCDIVGSRIGPDGVLKDPTGILISSAPGDQSNPDVAFDGSNFVVIWNDLRDPANAALYEARVSPDGTVLDPDGLALVLDQGTELVPRVAVLAGQPLAVWVANTGNTAVLSTMPLAPNGSNHIPTFTLQGPIGTPAITAQNTDFLVVWPQSSDDNANDIHAMRFRPTGASEDATGIVVSASSDDEAECSVAFDGQQSLVVWAVNAADGPDIYGARVAQTGEVLDAQPRAIAVASARQEQPAVVFQDRFIVAWSDNRNETVDNWGQIFAVTLDADLKPDMENGYQVVNAGFLASQPALVPTPAGVSLLSMKMPVNSAFHNRLGADLIATRAQPVHVDPGASYFMSWKANRATEPVVSAGPHGALLLWADTGAQVSPPEFYGEFRASRIGVDGKLEDPIPLELAPWAPDDKNQVAAAVTPAGWLAAATSVTQLVLAQVPASGSPVTQSFQSGLDTVFMGVGLACSSDTCLLAWSTDTYNGMRTPADFNLYGQRFTPEGAPMDTKPRLLAHLNQWSLQQIEVASNGKEFLVAYVNPEDNLYAIRLDSTGNPLDAAPFKLANSCTSCSQVAVAPTGTGFVSFWLDETSPSQRVIESERIGLSGASDGPVNVTPSGISGDSFGVVASPSGELFGVWDDAAGQQVVAALDASGQVTDIHRVRRLGPDSLDQPTLGFFDDTRGILVSSDFLDAPGLGTSRLRVSLFRNASQVP